MAKKRARSKRPKLSKAERYCITYMYNAGHTIDYIAKELRKSPNTIAKYLASEQKIDVAGKPEHTTETKNEANKQARDLFIHNAVGGRGGVTIMTQEQSQMGDEARRRARAAQVRPSHTHQIRQ